MFHKFKIYKFSLGIIQSKFPKHFIQNLSRISLILFSQILTEIFSIFFWSFLYFFQKYLEILINYWRKVLRKLEKNYEILK